MKSRNALRVSFPHLLVFVLYFGYSNSNSKQANVNPGDPHACFAHEGLAGPVYRCCDGYYLNDSACIECHDGRYGRDCSYSCLCQNGGVCNATDGSCQCPYSHYGAVCAFPCPCKNNGTCNDKEGIFQSCTCKEGYYGYICENKCSCPNGTFCDPVSGCLCENGTWGVNCVGVCNCQANRVCDVADGSCKCQPGLYGDGCQRQCNCFNGGECDNVDPNVCKCLSTWRGPDCTNCNNYESDGEKHDLCADKCLHCYNGNDCTPEDKTCNCTPGWHGDRCDQQCETGYYGYNCSGKCPCKSFELCNHVTGYCSCRPGYYGPLCNKACPTNCLACDRDTDYCMSCVTGWTGVNCELHLPENGNEINCTDANGKCICTESCRENCIDGSCDPYKGYTIGIYIRTQIMQLFSADR
ncbi:multiple epidermal growth factor-like domains protein 10 isoform X2 [Ptychodera flava]|uniref:multiple epidermal growth factor-like domains protein 10 isoform X2 n=1 Tax=Ptychodera flava TaxID=63121 RepID=UPI00396A0925